MFWSRKYSLDNQWKGIKKKADKGDCFSCIQYAQYLRENNQGSKDLKLAMDYLNKLSEDDAYQSTYSLEHAKIYVEQMKIFLSNSENIDFIVGHIGSVYQHCCDAMGCACDYIEALSETNENHEEKYSEIKKDFDTFYKDIHLAYKQVQSRLPEADRKKILGLKQEVDAWVKKIEEKVADLSEQNIVSYRE